MVNEVVAVFFQLLLNYVDRLIINRSTLNETVLVRACLVRQQTLCYSQNLLKIGP